MNIGGIEIDETLVTEKVMGYLEEGLAEWKIRLAENPPSPDVSREEMEIAETMFVGGYVAACKKREC